MGVPRLLRFYVRFFRMFFGLTKDPLAARAKYFGLLPSEAKARVTKYEL